MSHYLALSSEAHCGETQKFASNLPHEACSLINILFVLPISYETIRVPLCCFLKLLCFIKSRIICMTILYVYLITSILDSAILIYHTGEIEVTLEGLQLRLPFSCFVRDCLCPLNHFGNKTRFFQ